MPEKPIKLHQFGQFEIKIHGRSIDTLSRKTRSILAYLAATPRTYSRAQLYNLFCQSASDPAATLRWHLSRLRRLLHNDILLPDQHTITFNHEIAFVDSLEFQSALTNLPGDSPSIERLRHVLALHRGEYLADCHLRHAPEFEFWLTAERTRLSQLYERGLLALIDRLILEEELLEAISWLQRLLSVNALLEAAHFRAVWLYARIGQRERALQQFELCKHTLRDELAVGLSEKMYALLRDVRSGQLPPAEAFVVTPNGSQQEVNQQVPIFVGRDAELKRLLQEWKQYWKTSGGVVMINAAAGGGKTRFAVEFVSRLPNFHLVRGHCHESSRHTPYYPWLEILEASLRQISHDQLQEFDPFLLSQLSYLVPALASQVERGSARADFSTTHFSLAVLHFLRYCNNRAPLALLVDDLQWADAASLSLFQFIGNRLPMHSQQPFLLIGAYRTEEKQDNAALLTLERDLSRLKQYISIALEPLTPDAVDTLLKQKLNSGTESAELRKRIVNATGGNPLYVTEILSELSDHPGLNGSLPVPLSIRELVERRMQQLTASGQQVMEAVAVLNRPVSVEVLQAISGRSEDEVFETIEAGLRWHLLRTYEASGVDLPRHASHKTTSVEARTEQKSRLVQQDDNHIRFGYFHDLMRDAVWGQLNAIRKQRLHKRTAQALILRNAPPAQLVHHWHGAGDVEQEAHYSALAGREATEVFSYKDAKLHLQRALQLATNIRTRAELLIDLGMVLFPLGEWDTLQSVYEQALEMAVAEALREIEMKALFGLGQLHRSRGLYGASIQFMEKAAVIARALEDYEHLSGIMGGIGSAYWRQGEHAKALTYQEHALSIALEHDDAKGASMVHGGMGAIYANLQDFEKALFHYRECLKIAQERQDRSLASKVTTNIGIVYARQNDLQRGLASFLEGLQREYDMGDQLGVATALNNVATVAKILGAYNEARQCTWYALNTNLRLRNLRGITLCIGSLADIEMTQRHYHAAAALLAKAIVLGRHLNLRYELTAWLLFEAERMKALNLVHAALSSCREALSLAKEVSRDDIVFRALLLEVILRVSTGEIGDQAAREELTQQLSEITEPEQQAMILDTMSEVDPTDETVRLQAAHRYRDLYRTVPNTLFRDRYSALTGESLSDNAIEVVLPQFITDEPINQAAMMSDIEKIVEEFINS